MSDCIFQHDVFKYEIIKYIENKDIISLYYAGLITKKILYSIFINLIITKLGSVHPSIVKLLMNNEIALTGSFILETILGEQWRGDIDFLCSNKLENICVKYIKDLNFDMLYKGNISGYKFKIIEFFIPLDKNGNIKTAQFILLNDGGTPASNSPILYGNKCEKYTKILNDTDIDIEDSSDSGDVDTEDVDTDDVKYFKKLIHNHIDTYDFNVVKNLFYYNKGKFVLYIDDLESVYSKNLIIYKDRYSSMSRYNKYFDRGFKINENKKNILEILSSLYAYNGCNVIDKSQLIDENYDNAECINNHCYTNFFTYKINHKHTSRNYGWQPYVKFTYTDKNNISEDTNTVSGTNIIIFE